MILILSMFGCISQQQLASVEVGPPEVRVEDWDNDSLGDVAYAEYPPVKMGPIELRRYIFAYPVPRTPPALDKVQSAEPRCRNVGVLGLPAEYLQTLRASYLDDLNEGINEVRRGNVERGAEALARTCGNELYFVYHKCPCHLSPPFSNTYTYNILIVVRPVKDLPFLSLSLEDIIQVKLLNTGVTVRSYPESTPVLEGQSIKWTHVRSRPKMYFYYSVKSHVRPSAGILERWPLPSISFTVLPYSDQPAMAQIYEALNELYLSLAPLGNVGASAVTLGILIFVFFETTWFLSFLFFLFQAFVSPDVYESQLKQVMGRLTPHWKVLLFLGVLLFVVPYFLAGRQPLYSSFYDFLLKAGDMDMRSLLIIPMALGVLLIISLVDASIKDRLYYIMLPPKVKKIKIIKSLVNRGKELSTRARRLGIDFVDEYETILTAPVNVEDQSEIDRAIDKLTNAINSLKSKVSMVESNINKWLQKADEVRKKKGEVTGDDLKDIPPEWRKWVLEKLSEKKGGVVVGESFIPHPTQTKPLGVLEMDNEGTVLKNELPRGIKLSYVRVAVYRLNERIERLVEKVGGEPVKIYIFGRGPDVGVMFLPSSIKVVIAENIKKVIGK